MKLKVMTWNVENLFHAGTDGGPATEEIYRAKVRGLATAIETLDADIVAVQEIGSPDTFADLIKELGKRYPHHHLSKKPDQRHIRVGLLSKQRLDDPKDVVDFAPNEFLSLTGEDGNGLTRMRRGALWAKTTIGPLTVNIVTAHLKSKLLTFPGEAFSTKDEGLRARVASLALAERTQEAVTLRTLVNQIFSKHEDQAVIVLAWISTEGN